MNDQLFGILFVTVVVLVAVVMAYAGFCEYRHDKKVLSQARQKLTNKTMVVAIRMKDGKRNYWETLFIKQLMDLGAKVLDFSPEGGNHLWTGDRDQIPSGAMAFVGTTWDSDGVWYIDGKFLPVRTKETTANETVLAPFFSVHGDVAKLHTNLAECVSHYL
jgi:hypothetical protein